MKWALIILLTIWNNNSQAGEVVQYKNQFKRGDCFLYADATSAKNNIKYMVGRVEFLNFGTWDFEGTLYGKKVKKEKPKDSAFATFHFQLPFAKQDKYTIVQCPNDLPKLGPRK
jgi:hypothetical protein